MKKITVIVSMLLVLTISMFANGAKYPETEKLEKNLKKWKIR